MRLLKTSTETVLQCLGSTEVPKGIMMSAKCPLIFTKPRLSKKHQIRLDTPWLDPNKALAEQVF